MITLVYKTGLSNSLDGEKFKPARRNAKKDNTKTSNELCSHTVNEDNKLCSHSSDDTPSFSNYSWSIRFNCKTKCNSIRYLLLFTRWKSKQESSQRFIKRIL